MQIIRSVQRFVRGLRNQSSVREIRVSVRAPRADCVRADITRKLYSSAAAPAATVMWNDNVFDLARRIAALVRFEGNPPVRVNGTLALSEELEDELLELGIEVLDQ